MRVTVLVYWIWKLKKLLEQVNELVHCLLKGKGKGKGEMQNQMASLNVKMAVALFVTWCLTNKTHNFSCSFNKISFF